MRKNIIYLLIDCFDYNRIGANAYRNSATPFLDSLKNKSYWLEKMYSQAPFTEGAMMGTHCGCDTLDHGGYLMRYKNCPETLFEMMHQGGYRVYAQMWPHFYPSSAIRGIDDLKLRANSFGALWAYRLQYYTEVYNRGELEQQDMQDIVDMLRDNLEFWLEYIDMVENSDPRLEMVLENAELPSLKKDRETLVLELEKFRSAPEAYAQQLLQKGREHILFSLYDDECLNKKVPQWFVKKIADKYQHLNQRVYKTSNQRNMRNNPPSISKMWEYFNRSENPLDLRQRTQFSQYLRNVYQVYHQKGLLERIGPEYDKVKDGVSLHYMMDMFLKWQEDRKDDQPYFAYIHNDDIHGPSAFFDYCSTDETQIDASMKAISDYLDHLPANYRGNLGYDLGVLNVDRQIEWFYHELERRGILEDTILVISSDHGCGTNYYPIRGFVQNYHDECYHVPFVLCGADVEPKIDTDFHLTKDSMATLADLAGITPHPDVTGISVFSEEKRDLLRQEYMGPGCPDVYRRPIWMCAFDNHWKVFIKVRLFQDSFVYDLEEIYHLDEDRLEKYNLYKSVEAHESVAYLLNVLRERWEELKASYHRG